MASGCFQVPRIRLFLDICRSTLAAGRRNADRSSQPGPRHGRGPATDRTARSRRCGQARGLASGGQRWRFGSRVASLSRVLRLGCSRGVPQRDRRRTPEQLDLPRQRWRVRLSEPAEQDFLAILSWTIENSGRRQARVYRRTLIAALTALHDGADVPGSAARYEIHAGVRSLHVGRNGGLGRHIVLYRASGATSIEVIRLLDDAMDLPGNLPSNPWRPASWRKN